MWIRILIVGLAGLLLSACSLQAAVPGPAAGAGMPQTNAPTRLAPGASAPDFTAPDLAGRPVHLTALRGHPVWINFWATWCPPCKTEMPLMEQKYQQYQPQRLVILGINMQESPDAVQRWVAGKFHWRFLLDGQGKLADLFNVEGLPTHIFIDRGGVIRSVHIGELAPAEMDAGLSPILAR